MERAADSAFWIDRDGRLVYVNDAACSSLGLSREELQSMTVNDIDAASTPTELPLQWEELKRLGSVTFETQHQAADGRVFPVEVTANYIEFGTEEYNFAFARDISERKRLELQLGQAQKMEAIGTLAGGVAHDFNNMLSAIMSYTDLAIMKLAPQDQLRPYLQEVLKAADRAAHLTRQLLTFSRRQAVEPRVLNLNDVIINVDKMLRRLIKENIELVTMTQPDLSLVTADLGQIEQVLMNLVVNASDAMPDGGKLIIETANVTLDRRNVQQLPDLRPGEYATIKVIDDGTGIDEEVQTHIFEPFFTTKEVGKGTGLGLSMCYGIVTQSGGHIALDSKPGAGASFTVYLPATSEPAEVLPLSDDSGFLPSGSEVIMLIEDEPMVRSATSRVLRQQGYAVIEAPNGMEAMRIAREWTRGINLLLTDVVMPLMGGVELAGQFVRLHPEAKVLYTSGYTDDPRLRQGGDRSSFMQKPFTPRDLAQRVREILDAPVPA